MKLTGVYDETWFTDSVGEPTVVLYCRDKEGNKDIKKIKNFRPYFYTSIEHYHENKKQLMPYILSIELIDKQFILNKDKKLIKLIFKNYFDQVKAKGILNEIYEGDIQYVHRYLLDEVDEIESTDYRLNYFDIETTSDKGFPDYKNPNEKIISIVSYDNYLDKYITWIWHKIYNEEIEEQKLEDGLMIIKRFNNEENMLNDYINFINETQPDYMLAWNVGFDIRYFVARCERLKLEVEKLSPAYNTKYNDKINMVKWYKGPGVYGKLFTNSFEEESNIQISGLQYFDLLTGYKKTTAKEMPSWTLNYIANFELGEQKLDTHFDIGKKWKTEPKFIEKYNYIDVLLIKKLDEKLKILDYFLNIRNSSFFVNINNVFSSGKVLDSYVLKKYRDKYVFPTKPSYDANRINKPVGGGLVRENIPGVRENIVCVDFSAFYPNIIKTFNLSGDTIKKCNIILLDTNEDEIQDEIEIDMKEKMYEYDEKNKLITYKIRTNKFKADLTYDISRKGVMAEAVEKLIELRKEAKKEMKQFEYGTKEYQQKDKTQFSYKFIINAAYGTSAYSGFRLYSNENANAITGFARMLSKWISYKLKQKGWETVAGDTDSVFLQLYKSKTLEENIKESEEIIDNIKIIINEFVKRYLPEEFIEQHTLNMEIEKIYSRLLLLDVKKRYIGFLKYYDGKPVNDLHYMGLDLKKSNTIKISKDAQMDLALAILKKENVENIFKKYYELTINSDDFNLFKKPGKLEKHQAQYKTKTPSVRGSLWSNKNLGTKFRGGTKFYLLYTQPNAKIDTDVIAFENLNQINELKFKLDKIKYCKDVYNKFNNLIRGIPELFEKNNSIYKEHIISLKEHNKFLNKIFSMKKEGQQTLI